MNIKKRRVSELTSESKGLWASAACEGDIYGVVIGQDDKVIGFVPESFLDASELEAIESESSVQAELIRRALRDLPRLKADLQRINRHSMG
jgi:hypothetical protein